MESNLHLRFRNSLLMATLLCCAILSGCCSNLRLPAIDPTGERIFLPAPNATTFDNGSSFAGPAWPSVPQAPAFGSPLAGAAVVPYSINTPTPPLFGPNPNAAFGSTGGGPIPASPTMSGFTSDSPSDGVPGRLSLNPPNGLTVPVGQEVLVRAAICGTDGYLVTNEPLEWSLSPNSVGTIVEVDEQNKSIFRQLFHRPPAKLQGDFAYGVTSRAPQVVPRGAPGAFDDLQLVRGETWVTLTSSTPGETHLHCRAPNLAGWEQRRAATTIRWVSGQPGVNPAGQVPTPAFPTPANPAIPANTPPTIPPTTTTPPITNPAPTQPAPVTRPELQLSINGPPAAKEGEELNYTIRVVNRGDAAAERVRISSKVPIGLRFDRSDPPAKMFGDQIVWDIDRLAPDDSQTITFREIAEQGGRMQISAVAEYDGANPIERSTTTDIAFNPLSVELRGPETAQIGQVVPFQVVVTNKSNQELTNLRMEDRYSDAFYAGVQDARGAIFVTIPNIPPGQTATYPLPLTVLGAGRLCHEVSVFAGDNVAKDDICIQVGPDSAGTSPEGSDFASPLTASPVALQKTGPREMAVGEQQLFTITVTNVTNGPLNGLQVVDEFDARLSPIRATRGVERNAPTRMSWRLPQLASGESATIEVLCEALEPTGLNDQACNRATVLAGSGLLESKVMCLRILPRGASTREPQSNLARHGSIQPPPPTMVRRETNPNTGRTSRIELRPIANSAASQESAAEEWNASQNRTQSKPRSPLSPFRPLGSRETTSKTTGNVGSLTASPATTLVSTEIDLASRFADPFPSNDQSRSTGEWDVDIRRRTGSGQRLTYTLSLSNRDIHVQDNVVLTVQTPDGCRFVDAQSPPMVRPSKHSKDGRTIEFLPIHAVRPGETATFQIVVDRLKASVGPFRLRLVSDQWPVGAVYDETGI